MGYPATTTEGESVEIVAKARDDSGAQILIDSAGNKYVPSTEPLKLELVEAAQAIEAGAESIVSELKEAAVEIGGEIGEALGEINDAVDAAVEDVKEEVGDVVEAAGDFVGGLVEGAKDAIADVGEAIEELTVDPTDQSPPANEGGLDGVQPAGPEGEPLA